MIRILTSDILPVDIHTSLIDPQTGERNDKLAAVIRDCGLITDKNPINAEQYKHLAYAIAGNEVKSQAAGPAVTQLILLKQLLGDEVESNFIGVAGSNRSRRKALEGNDIQLIPENLAAGRNVQSPVTYMIRVEGDKYIKATYPGNIAEFLKPGIIREEMVDNADIVLVMGSLWQRVDKAFPDRLMDLAEQKGKKIWMTLPTHADYTIKNACFLQGQIARADLVMGNDGELARIYGSAPEEAFARLQRTFQESGRRQIGFITYGRKGAKVITADRIVSVDTLPIEHVANVAGAGDTAFGAFAAAQLKGLSLEDSAKVAMVLANQKLREDSPRLTKNAKMVLKDAAPDLAALMFAGPELPTLGSGGAKAAAARR